MGSWHSRRPACAELSCEARGAAACSYVDDAGGCCGTWWCDRHLTLIDGRPHCPIHAVAFDSSPGLEAIAAPPSACAEPGCGARVVWPCGYLDQDRDPCGGSWCLEHVEYVNQARYCSRHAELIASRLGSCARPGCSEREVWLCNHHDRAGAACSTQWCRDHMTFVGAVPFCDDHAHQVEATRTEAASPRRTVASLPDLSHGLAQLVCDSLDAELMEALRQRFGSVPAVLVTSDREIREVSFQRRQVWWRIWGAFTQAGYLGRIAVWVPRTASLAEATIHVLVDGRPIVERVPGWASEDGKEVSASEHDLANLCAEVVEAVRGVLFQSVPVPGQREVVVLEPPSPSPGPAETPYPPVTRPALRVVVAAEDEAMIRDVGGLLRHDAALEVVGIRFGPESTIMDIGARVPDAIVVGLTSDQFDGAGVVKRLRARMPAVPILLVADGENCEGTLRARAAGARDLLIWPFAPADLVDAIKRATGLIAPPAVALPPPGPASKTPPSEARAVLHVMGPSVSSGRQAPTGLLTMVLGGQGGVGKSLLATNVAAALAAASGEEVGLVDLDLQFGDQALMLGINPTTSMANVVEGYPHLDPDFLQTLMLPAGRGLRVLPATTSPELADLVTFEHVRALVRGLRDLFGHTVVDCGAHLDDRVLEAVGAADSLILVTDLTLAGIKNTKLLLGVLDKLQVPRHRFFVVVNRVDIETVISPNQVANLLHHPVAVQISTIPTRSLKVSIEKGAPLYGLFPESELARRTWDLIGQMGYRAAKQPQVLSS